MILKGRFPSLRLLGGDDSPTRWPQFVIESGPLRLRPPVMNDFEGWSALRAASRDFLAPWEPIWPEDDLTRAAFRRRIRRYNTEIETDEAYPFFIFSTGDNCLLGGLTLGNIRRGAAQTATLGYWMGQSFAGKGIMTRAASMACNFGFMRLGLVRIDAACLPENGASIHLLEKVGFQKEGTARSYLNIAGWRRDHLLFALLSTDGMLRP